MMSWMEAIAEACPSYAPIDRPECRSPNDALLSDPVDRQANDSSLNYFNERNIRISTSNVTFNGEYSRLAALLCQSVIFTAG